MTGNLSGKRILVVEDEYFIATDLRGVLVGEDAVVLGPTADIAQALSILSTESVDMAILDVNLQGGKSYPVADRLLQDHVPYMFLTGYEDWAIPEPYRAAARVSKPYPAGAVVACLEGLVQDRGSA